ncbi:MAG: glycosyltransferase family 4 protein [Solirubrobacterales bacterium]
MNPMRVLYCILDNRFGGPHRLAMTVSRELRRYGVETLFLLGQKSEDVWRPDGFRVFLCKRIQCFTRRHPLWNLAGFCVALPWNLVKIRRLIRSNNIDVVHVDGITNFVPAIAARLAHRPVVWHYNDHLPGVLQRILLRLVNALAYAVIVQGRKLRDIRTGAVPSLHAKTVVVPSAIDPSEFRPDEQDARTRARLRADLGVGPEGPLIGMIGNMNRFKGHAYFIQAAQRIKEQVGNARFVIVGRRLDTDPGYWDQLQRLTVECGLKKDMVYAGFRDDVPSVLSALDVFVLSSILESCPVVLLEAMAMKTPVVATDVGAVSEMIAHGRTGFVVPPRDPESIAQAVLAILAKPPQQVREMVEQARKTVERDFSVDTIASQQLRVYEHPQGPWVSHI